MKGKSIAFSLTMASAFFLCAACGVGTDPAWKTQPNTAVCLSLAVLGSGSSGPSRAAVQGAGYLYIRTVGGPAGPSGPFYGPFAVSSGATFTTTAIPAGTYASFGIMYSSEPLDARTLSWNGKTYTFAEAVRLPDADFMALMKSSDGKLLANLSAGVASGAFLDNVTIVARQTNNLKATLVPAVDEAGWIDLSAVKYKDVVSDGTSTVRRFFALGNAAASVAPGMAIENVSVSFAAAAASDIGIVALYDQNGVLLGSAPASGPLAAGGTKTVVLPYAKSDGYFLYVEYKSASFRLSFDRALKPVGSAVSVKLTGAGAYKGKSLFFGLSKVSPLSGTLAAADYAGYGYASIGADGSAAAAVLDLAMTGVVNPATLSGNYYIVAFIDADGSVSDLSNASYSDGDPVYISASPIKLSGVPSEIPLDIASFTVFFAPAALTVFDYVDPSLPADLALEKDIFAKFAAANPDITLQVQYLGEADYVTALNAMEKSGNLPDIMYLWPSVHSLGVLVNHKTKDLSAVLPADLLNAFPSVLKDTGKIAGGYLGMMPRGITYTGVMYVNKKLLADNGLVPATTYAEMKAQVPTLATKNIYTLALPDADQWPAQSCLLSTMTGRMLGNDFLKQVRLKTGYKALNGSEFVGVLNMYKTMIDDGVLSPAMATLDYGAGPTLFAQGKAAYFVDGDWRVAAYQSDGVNPPLLTYTQQTNDIALMPLPAFPGEVNAGATAGVLSTGWGINASIVSGSPKEKAAIRLFSYLYGKEVLTRYLEAGKLVPLRGDVTSSSISPLTVKLLDFYKTHANLCPIIDDALPPEGFDPINSGLLGMLKGTHTAQLTGDNAEAGMVSWRAKP